jgi:Holliday junction resolvase RusA-like endonuclease
LIHKTIPVQVWADIDTEIAEAVRYLNTIPDVRTHASCQGSDTGPAPYKAYVMVGWGTEEARNRLGREFGLKEEGEGWGYVYPKVAAQYARQLRITIPLEPPSVNHYKKPVYLRGGRLSYAVTKEAKAFLDAVCIFARGQALEAEAYEVEYTVYQGKGSRGDVDNYSKCILDGLVQACVITSDAAVTDLHQHKRRDWANPRTEIVVRAACRPESA